MSDDYFDKTEENSEEDNSVGGDSNCPRCGIRTYEETCPVCGTPLNIKKGKDDDEDEYYERRREKR